MTPRDIVIEAISNRLVELWNEPAAQRPPGHAEFAYDFNPRVAAKRVVADLVRRFGRDAVESAIVAMLEGLVEAFDDGRIPDQRGRFLATCMLALVSAPDVELAIPRPLAKDIVRVFSSIVWFPAVQGVIARHLSKTETLEALRDGLTLDANVDVCLSCMEGLRLYRNGEFAPGDEQPLAALKLDAEARLTRLRRDPETIVTNSIGPALEQLARW
jgi:hypothetical protein